MTIESALNEKVWAVLGATANKNKFGYKIYMCLKKHGYKVYPINPNVDEIDGDICYSSIAELPETPSVVDFVVPERVGVAAVTECKAKGVKCLFLQPGADKDSVVKAAEEVGLDVIKDCVLVQLKEN